MGIGLLPKLGKYQFALISRAEDVESLHEKSAPGCSAVLARVNSEHLPPTFEGLDSTPDPVYSRAHLFTPLFIPDLYRIQ